MRFRLLLAACAIAGHVQAADSVEVVHVNGAKPGQPMAWRYSLPETAQATFEKQAALQAPGATLAFRLPNVDPVESDSRVELVNADQRLTLPMVLPTTFALVPGVEAKRGAMVIVNKEFPKGSYRHPNVKVRTPGLPDGVQRMGDLRLACAAQIDMAKAESFKFRALLMTAGMFGDICAESEVNSFDPPSSPYDTITIEDGERKLVYAKSQGKLPQLGDKSWSDNARIHYSLNEKIVH